MCTYVCTNVCVWARGRGYLPGDEAAWRAALVKRPPMGAATAAAELRGSLGHNKRCDMPTDTHTTHLSPQPWQPRLAVCPRCVCLSVCLTGLIRPTRNTERAQLQQTCCITTPLISVSTFWLHIIATLDCHRGWLYACAWKKLIYLKRKCHCLLLNVFVFFNKSCLHEKRETAEYRHFL